MTIETIVSMVTTGLLLICSALISGSEVAYFSLTPIHLEELQQSNRKSDLNILNLLGKPKRLLATILISNNFINVAIVLTSTILMESLIDLQGVSELSAFIIQVVAVTFIILLIGEVIPKVYATTYSIKLARFMSAPLGIISKLLTPFSRPLAASTVFIDKRIKKKSGAFSVDELDQALEITYDNPDTDDDEKKILKGIVKFGNTDVTQIMTARVDVKAVSVDMEYNDLIAVILDSGYSRIPVYKETFDQVVGVLYIKDLLPYLNTTKENWQELIRSPFYVPENKKIDDLLKEFQEKKIHLAIVVDEYGGASGIVSLEDIIEEIVGDISDEFDDEDILYSKLDDNNFVFEGKTPLMDLYRVLNIEGDMFEQEKGEAETLAGFLIEKSGKILMKNERLTFENYLFTVEASDKRKIKRVKVTIQNKPTESKQKSKKTFNFLMALIAILTLTECGETAIPKQKGYFRIDIPEHNYIQSELDCPFSFEYSKHSYLGFSNTDKKEKCWPDIFYPKLNAKIYLTYQNFNTQDELNNLLKDSHKLTYDHAVKANGILSKRIDIDSSKVHALLFEVKGNVASNVQFFATDSAEHFFRGSLYFYNEPNADSLAPALNYITEDIKHLVETLRWN